MSIEDQRRRLHGNSVRDEVEELLVKEIIEENEDLRKENRRLTGIIETLSRQQHPHHKKPLFNVYFDIKNQSNIMANAVFVIGSPKTGLFSLTDNKTLLPIQDVKYSNQALGANSNPEFATFAIAQTDPNDPTSLNSVVGTPLAAGTGTLVITTAANYTDPGDGSAQSGAFSVTKTFVVQASADGATFDVVFP